MKRKTIAVCVTGFDLEYETDVVYGVYKKCQELGLNLLVFYNPTRKPQRGIDLVISEAIGNGEMSVYKLMDYDNIDGIVIFGESILIEDTYFEIARKAREHGIPLIDVDDLFHDVGLKLRNIIPAFFFDHLCQIPEVFSRIRYGYHVDMILQ